MDNTGESNSNSVINHILRIVCDCLICKQPISDDLLLIAWEYCVSQEMELKLLALINKVIGHTLSQSNPCRTRDYFWFKKYIIDSNIWYQFVTIRESNLNTSSTNVSNTKSIISTKKTTVYDLILETVNEELSHQQRYMQTQLELLRKSVTNYRYIEEIASIPEINRSGVIIRQDSLLCNKAQYSSYDLSVTNDNNFNSEKEYDTKIYLTNLLITARVLNDDFQSQMEKFVDIHEKSFKFKLKLIKTNIVMIKCN